MILASKLLMEGEMTPESLRGLGRCNAPVELLSRWIDRRNARAEGFAMASSLLSEGLRPFEARTDALFRGSLGRAEGQRVVREASWLKPDVEEPLDSRLGRVIGKL